MGHEDFSRAEPAHASTDRSFGLVVGGVLMIIGLAPLSRAHAPRWWAVAPGGILLVLGWLRQALLHGANLLWTQLGLLLNRVVSPIVIGVLFLFVFTPMGLVLRLLGKDLLRLHFDRAADSYWIKRDPPGPAPDSMANQF
jgi:hypothetical protein